MGRRYDPHALRELEETAITQLIERGVPVPIVQRLAGHADVATTMRYCSVADDVYADRTVHALGGERRWAAADVSGVPVEEA